MSQLGYYDYLKGLLEPLGLYELETGSGAAELKGIGARLDEILDSFEELGSEVLPLKADGYGLENFEALFPYKPSYITLDDRRRAVAALLRIRNGYFTVTALCDTLSGCGISAVAAECETPMTIVVTFPNNRGILEDFDKLKQRIEQILPCHLAIEYRFIFVTWEELMAGIPSWGVLENLCKTWRELEAFKLKEE